MERRMKLIQDREVKELKKQLRVQKRINAEKDKTIKERDRKIRNFVLVEKKRNDAIERQRLAKAKLETAKWTKEIRKEEQRRQKLIEKAVNKEKARLRRNEKARERYRQKKAKEEAGWKGSEEPRKLRTKLENKLRKILKDRNDFQAVLVRKSTNGNFTEYFIKGNNFYDPKMFWGGM
jgi:hypothetical protein